MRPEQHAPEQHPSTVLVIDDEDYVADMIASALEIEGYTVYAAYNGRDGLEQATSRDVDLVIIDIMMPYLNGIDLAQQLRAVEHLHAIPIILISAGARPRQALPHVRFVAKPFDMDQMISFVTHDLAAAGKSQ